MKGNQKSKVKNQKWEGRLKVMIPRRDALINPCGSKLRIFLFFIFKF